MKFTLIPALLFLACEPPSEAEDAQYYRKIQVACIKECDLARLQFKGITIDLYKGHAHCICEVK